MKALRYIESVISVEVKDKKMRIAIVNSLLCILLTGCGSMSPMQDSDGLVTLSLAQDLILGHQAIPRGTSYPVYASEDERVVFLINDQGAMSYGLVLDPRNCHVFDGLSGFRSFYLGYSKDTCRPFCYEVKPTKICFE